MSAQPISTNETDCAPQRTLLPLPFPASVPVQRLPDAAVLPLPDRGEAAHLPLVDGADLVRQRLAAALVDGETALAEALATQVWRQFGLTSAHSLLSLCLADAAERTAFSSNEWLTEKAMTATVRAVLERLRAATPAPTGSATVIFGVPPGDNHTLALTALAHLVEQSGRNTLIVDDLPTREIAALAAWPSTLAVVISAHLPLRTGQLRSLVGQLRSIRPDLLVVVGGPGIPRRAPSLATVAHDENDLLAALEGHDSVLSQREREVMLAVADGFTNSEIADQLGLSPSTVKTHLDRIFVKTGTVHRAAAVAHALRRGWIS